MSAAVLLSQLKSLGVDVVANDGRLRVNAARGQLTDELKVAIASQKAELLALLSSGSGLEHNVPRVRRDGRLPLSFFQERLWVQSRFEPNSTAYNMVAAWASTTPVDASHVVRAIGAIVSRHEILRSSFREKDGIPSVHLLPPDAVSVIVKDLGGRPEHEQQSEIRRDFDTAAHTPFDLREEPTARFVVYRVADGRIVTQVAAHHIAMDAWSLALLGREITAAYEGGETPQGEPPLQYVDFAAWQRASIDDRALAAELGWWKQRLSGSPPVSTLPPDLAKSGNPSERSGATQAFRFSRELSDGIRALVREERATTYMALLSACAVVLHRYTGQEDLVLGSPMGLRERPEFESIIGPFVNLLVLRLDLSGAPTFAEVLGRARASVLDAHDHRQVPFERLVEHLNPARSREHAPLFQVAVVQHSAGGEGLGIQSGGALFDLTWFIREIDGELACALEYRSDLYSAELIERMATQLETVLTAAVVNRHQRIAALPVPGVDELVPRLLFWQKALAGLPRFALTPDKVAPEHPPSRRDVDPHTRQSEPVHVSSETLSRLRRIGQAEGAELSAVLLSAFNVLLHRQSGQSDIVVGVPVSVAPEGGGKRPAANLLPVRVQIDSDATFSAVVRATRDVVRAAEAHAVPAEKLTKEPESGGPATPLFLVQFTFGGSAAPRPPSTRRGAWSYEESIEIALHIAEREHGGAGFVDYEGERFEAISMRRLVRQFLSILDAVAEDPELVVSRIPRLSAADREEMLALAREACGTAHATTPVIQLFEEQARCTPDATAVIDGARIISYRDLDQSANALASKLQALGAGPGLHVAVSLERSYAVIVALLAILKTRAAYVPLDPRYPPERVGYVLEDAEPVIIVTEERVRSRVPVPTEVAVVSVDVSSLASERTELYTAPPADPNGVAYVLYTSGSTGRPKGVEVPNRALTNFLASMRHTPGLTSKDTILSLTTISFDIAGLEIFLPLVTGACVHVVPSDVAVDGVRLGEFIRQSGATVVQATPSTWRMLIEANWRGDGRLKILCGGEAMPRELGNQLLARSRSVWNLYGPTETTIWSSVQRVAPGDGPVPVGRPIDDTPIYVLDRHGELVPHGAPGEIFIGGVGVARGYFKRDELTASRFIADPFAGGEARMYRTGDAGRIRSDGALEYLGRIDDQVKIRGHRIELGEIESVLREHPDIVGAVVLAREVRPGDVRLIGYYVPRREPIGVRELRELCRRKLPREMIPSTWVVLQAIPLTPNGKTDRKALPPPADDAAPEDVERIAPRDALEAQLVSIWEAALGTSVTSVRDSFFDLGGHSLLATRLFARIEDATGVSLPLATLIEGQTIEHLASCIRARRAVDPSGTPVEKSFSHVVAIRSRGTAQAVFCVHGAGGNVLNLYDIAKHLSPDRPFYAIQAAGVDGTKRPRRTIEEMAEDYLVEVRAVQPHGPYHLSGYCGGGVVAYEMAQRLVAAGEKVALLLLIDLYRPGILLHRRWEDTWAGELSRGDAPALLKRARSKVDRHVTLAMRGARVRYHLARGNTVPYALRDFWLTVSFVQAVQRYQFRPYPGKITVFRARDSGLYFGDPGPNLGWASLALGSIAAHEVPGDHYTLTHEPNVQVVAAQFEACLRMAEGTSSPRSTRGVRS